jgi:hypothetical protein
MLSLVFTDLVGHLLRHAFITLFILILNASNTFCRVLRRFSGID